LIPQKHCIFAITHPGNTKSRAIGLFRLVCHVVKLFDIYNERFGIFYPSVLASLHFTRVRDIHVQGSLLTPLRKKIKTKLIIWFKLTFWIWIV